MLSGSELWLLRLMADRGLALLDAGTLLIVIEERGELRVAASSGEETVRLRIMPVEGSALGELYRAGKPVSLDRPRGQEAAWLHELGLEARAALVEPLSMEGHGGGLVIALRGDGGFRGPDREALNAFATSVAQRLAAERSVEIERLRYGMEARERERTRWAREIHDETIQGLGALRLKLANARDLDEQAVAERGRGRGAGGAGRGDRRAAPPDHRASPRGARRPRPGGRAGGARAARAGDRRPGGADRDRPRPGARSSGAWTRSSRARSTASCRRRSRT